MANSFVDTTIIELNRLHSEDFKSNNNKNTSLWKNNLTDIVHLDAGDTISVQQAMISERGAGQPSSIEIKGKSLGVKKSFNHIQVTNIAPYDVLPSGYEQINCSTISTNLEMRDDTLAFNMGYYQTANAHNYIQLPRNWWYQKNRTHAQQWTDNDSTAAGQSLYYETVEYDGFSFKSEFHVTENGSRTLKKKNDNSRYTIMMRDETYYTKLGAFGNLGGFPTNDDQGGYNASLGKSRDPENATYHVYKELKQIKAPIGFNSPEYISTEITRQLQEIEEEKIWASGFESADVNVVNDVISKPNIYRTISTESYKPFNVANFFRNSKPVASDTFGVIEDAFNEYTTYTDGESFNGDGFDYLSQYHLVATKRPELYVTGSKLNYIYDPHTGRRDLRRVFGSELFSEWDVSQEWIILNQGYTKSKIDEWRDFLLAQEKYPEIWNFFSEKTNDYSSGDTIDNSRWCHINRWSNASMSYSGSDVDAMLGDSYYRPTSHAWFNPALKTQTLSSLLLPFVYDPSQRDVFHEFNKVRDNYLDNKLSYGCISCNKHGYIMIKTTAVNGITNASLMNELKANASSVNVEATRKIGFDMHFNAPGMDWILPYAGYSSYTQSFETSAFADYVIEPVDVAVTDVKIRGEQYVNKLYLGADSPKLNWNGNNFTFSDLHTPLNIGNDNRSGNPATTDYSRPTDGSETDIVYKINPKEQLNDWCPTRKPYIIAEAKHGSNSVNPLNSNLAPWDLFDSLCGITIEDFNLTESEWRQSLWNILGFSYNQFNSPVNNLLIKTTNNNVNSLQRLVTNAEVNSADSKIYVQNSFGAPLYNNMMPITTHFDSITPYYYPEILQKTTSIQIIGQNLPTRMADGYYTLRSDILSDTAFIGGKLNNTKMPVIGIVNKISNFGDYTFTGESSIVFTVTRPIKLASVTTSVHDPDGSYAHTNDASSVLIKIQKQRTVTYNVVQALIEQEQQNQQNKK